MASGAVPASIAPAAGSRVQDRTQYLCFPVPTAQGGASASAYERPAAVIPDGFQKSGVTAPGWQCPVFSGPEMLAAARKHCPFGSRGPSLPQCLSLQLPDFDNPASFLCCPSPSPGSHFLPLLVLFTSLFLPYLPSPLTPD